MERTAGMFTDMHEADLDKHVEAPHVLGGGQDPDLCTEGEE